MTTEVIFHFACAVTSIVTFKQENHPQNDTLMPLIKKEKKEVFKRLSVRLEESLLVQLTAYAAHLDSSKDYVIAEAVRYIMDRDKDFDGNLPQLPPQNMPQIPHQGVSRGDGEKSGKGISR